jgi:hypothetical protein
MDVVLAGAVARRAAEQVLQGIAGRTRQKGPGVGELEHGGPPSPDAVLSAVRVLAAKRADGLLTADQLGRALSCDAHDLEGVLRDLEHAGMIVVSPAAGRVAIVILAADGDDRALRRSVRVEGIAGGLPGAATREHERPDVPGRSV